MGTGDLNELILVGLLLALMKLPEKGTPKLSVAWSSAIRKIIVSPNFHVLAFLACEYSLIGQK